MTVSSSLRVMGAAGRRSFEVAAASSSNLAPLTRAGAQLDLEEQRASLEMRWEMRARVSLAGWQSASCHGDNTPAGTGAYQLRGHPRHPHHLRRSCSS